MDELFFLVIGLAVPVAVFVLFSRVGKLDSEVKRISRNMDFLYKRMEGERAGTAPSQPAKKEATPEAGPEPEKTPEPTPAPTPPPFAPKRPEAAPPAPRASAMAPAERATKPAGPTGPARPIPPGGKTFEQRFTERWMVWLGGIALALGGSFLVKYSIDIGLFGPGARIALGIIAAGAMVTIGEKLRRNSPMPKAVSGMLDEAPDYVPSAITAAGVFTAFATVYAAHALYDMIPVVVAFVLLAAVSFAGMALSLVHGPLLAFLGLVGAYTVPAIVAHGQLEPVMLFTYLLVVTAGSLEVVRYRQWSHLAIAALTVSTLWAFSWIAELGRAPDAQDALYASLFGLALTALYLLRLYPGSDPERPEDDDQSWFSVTHSPFWRNFVIGGAVSGGFIIFISAGAAGFTNASLLVAGLFVGLCGWVAHRDNRLDILLAGAGALAFSLLATWYIPHTTPTDAVALAQAPDWGPMARDFVPVEFQRYAITGGVFALMFLVGGFAGLWGAKRPGFWAAISTIMPLSITVLIYWRIHNYAPNLGWASTAIAIGAVFLFLAERTARLRDNSGMTAALSAYAIGVTTAVALGLSMLLENAWLTVALAMQLPAIGWVWQRLDVKGLRTTALILAGVVLVRLLSNPYILDYEISGSIPGVNWLLYGYGLPAAAFYFARRLFDDGSENRLQDVLEAGALIFAMLLVTLELRTLMSATGSISGSYKFAEQALQTINQLGFSLLLLRLEGRKRRAFYAWMRHGLMAILAFNIILVGGGAQIFDTGTTVGPWPIFNLLLLGYAIPGVLALLLYRSARDIGSTRSMQIYGVAGLVLIFVWLNFEVRHAFHGTNLASGPGSDGENYAYSFAWLAYAGALLAGGLWRGLDKLRHASLAVLMLAIMKVFLYDMGQLEGLWRALSFMGLGAVLVGIGYLYRRFVFPPAAGDKQAETVETPS